MFTLDVPVMPAQETGMVLAQANIPAGSVDDHQVDYILNYCKATPSTGSPKSAMRAVSPAGMLRNYLERISGRLIDSTLIKTSLIEDTKHGRITQHVSNDGIVFYSYDVMPDYEGKDRAIFLAEFEGKRYKIVVDLRVSKWVDEYKPVCPKPQLIKVKPSSSSQEINGISVGFSGTLPGGVLGQSVGTTITLDTTAAGYGWYIDYTPYLNDEYLPTSNPNLWVAKAGTEAAGKMDLLSVLLHEYGHALGLEHSADSGDYMAATLQPGMRRLPSSDELALMASLVAEAKASYVATSDEIPLPSGPFKPQEPGIPTPNRGHHSVRTTRARISRYGTTILNADGSESQSSQHATQYAIVANPTLTDAKLQTGTGWETTGNVAIGSGAAVLSETTRSQTRLNQVFTVGPNDRYLTFTLANIGLDDIANGPDDAFEVALLNADTGAVLTGLTGLTHNDAFLNLQANGTEFLGSNVTSTRNADGSRTYRLDLSGIPAGTAVNLSFDLIGFGGFANATSHVTVRDIRLGVPETRGDTATTAEDTALDIDVRGNDLDADQPGYTPVVVTGPAHGSVTLNADGSFRYVPLADWNGEDSFTYTLSDGSVDSNIATVSITVTAVNDAPVAADQGMTTTEDATLTLDLLAGASDIDSTTLTPTIVTGPAHGTLTQNADGTFTYAPAANWNGEDSFTYTVSDGELASGLATFRITVAPENDAPVVAPRTLEVDEDMPLIIDFLAGASDVDGDTLTVAITRPPLFGRLEQNADGSWTYAPNADWNGTDSIEYAIGDGTTTVTGTLAVRVRPVNDAPVLNPIATTLLEDGSVTLDLLANAYDADGDALNVAVAQPGYGQVVRNEDGTWTYTPAGDATGEDSFTWTVTDGQASATGVVRLTITAVNDAPVAVADIVDVAEDGSVTFNPLINDFDVDGDALTMQIISQPAHGSLVANADGSLTYTPAADWSGEDGFSYTVSDGSFVSAIAPVRLIVTPVADAPTLALTDMPGSQREVFRTGWESVADRNCTSTLVVQKSLEGWVLAMQPTSSFGGSNGFEIWSTGDMMMDAQNRLRTVNAMAGNGNNSASCLNEAYRHG